MTKVLTFGEIMMRLQPEGKKRFSQADGFNMHFGGGEANVAVSLARLGMSSAFFTKLPKNDFADKCIRELSSLGVDTSEILRGGERMGIYFCEQGASQRPSKIVYDRKYSSVNDITEDDINFSQLFKGVKCFHFTGITPALSENCKRAVTVLVKEAKRRKITVSCDLNYRKNLWTTDEARAAMTPLMQYVDILFSNEEDTKSVFGIEPKGNNIASGKLKKDGYKDAAAQIFAMFPNISTVCYTLRESISADVNNWSGMIATKEEAVFSKVYQINIVDRIGAGDSFAAGALYALLSGGGLSNAVEFAAAASCLKHTIEGDFNLVTKGEVEALMNGSGSGRVER